MWTTGMCVAAHSREVHLMCQRVLAVFLIGLAIAASGCDSNSSSPAAPSSGSGDGTSGNPITVFITNSVYSPNPLTVKAGQYVNFKNNDSIVHSATFDNGTYESGDIPPLSAHDAPVAMATAGTFGFHCRLHGEKGSIVVTQ
jgi:plastocyanin